MPAWEGEDSPEGIWHLVSFIRHLPQLTPEELKEMKGMSGEHADEKDERQPEKQKAGSESRPVQPLVDKPRTKPHKHTH